MHGDGSDVVGMNQEGRRTARAVDSGEVSAWVAGSYEHRHALLAATRADLVEHLAGREGVPRETLRAHPATFFVRVLNGPIPWNCLLVAADRRQVVVMCVTPELSTIASIGLLSISGKCVPPGANRDLSPGPENSAGRATS